MITKIGKCNCKTGRMSLVGDIIIRGSGPVYKALAGVDFNARNTLGNLLDKLNQADVLFANYEGIITTEEEQCDTDLPRVFYVGTHPAIIPFLESLGQKIVLSFANNHAADFGLNAIRETVGLLKNNERIIPVGIGTLELLKEPRIISQNNTRIAVLAFTDLLSSKYFSTKDAVGITQLNQMNLETSISNAKKVSDIIIVSVHTIGKNRNKSRLMPDEHQVFFSRMAIDLGADIVVGHHPHGVQFVEEYKGKHIFFSLGAFLYNPLAHSYFPVGHKFHKALKFHGGSVLTLSFCPHRLDILEWIPTRTVFIGDRIHVVTDSVMGKLMTRVFLWLK